jgi:nucleotide-binding universal stress UspA family protein
LLLYKKILVPVDGSDSSFRALHEAFKLAKNMGSEVTLINVYSAGSSVIMSSTQEILRNLALKEAQANLNRAKEAAKSEGVTVKELLLEGDAVDQIVKTAKDGNFDLIVMGARGLNPVAELVLGSTSHGVIKKAPCPVLITR